MNDSSKLPFDPPALHGLLKAHVPNLSRTPEVKAFRGGASNLTFALIYPDQTLIARTPPPGRKARGAHDMGREYRILSALQPHYPLVPETVLFTEDEAVTDQPLFVMEALEGLILRRDPPQGLELDSTITPTLCRSFVAALVDLHAIDIVQAGLGWLDRGPGYVERQIGGWSKRYQQARTPDAAEFEQVMTWLQQHQPEDRPHCLVHNDFRFDNLVLNPDDPGEITGVLDWELATVGDPLMDLGASLAYWVEADDHPIFQQLRRQPTHLPGMWSRDELISAYLERSGLEVDDFLFYEIYGLFRLAGIAQQIYYRHYHGQFKDDRFADFIHAVNYLEQRCLEQLGTGA